MIERSSATWRHIEQWANEQIKSLHQQNEKDLSERETAEIRGQIKLARQLLKLGINDQAPVIESGTYIG